MSNNDNNTINDITDNKEETISIEERNVFQDEFYPVNYEIQNNSALNEDKKESVNLEENNIEKLESDSEDIIEINNKNSNEIIESYKIPNSIENTVMHTNNQEEKIINIEEKEEAVTNNILESSANADGKYKKKTIIFYFIIGIIIGLIILFTIIYINSGKTKTVNCSYSKKDDAYTETEEYTITYTGDIISYIEGVYSYKTIPENIKQLDVIREQKIPVIVNSNGIDGFTHIFEIGETIFKAYSYYDYEIMNFDIVNKNDPSKTPISYINIDSSKSYKKMAKDLENRGFKCINSK